MTGNGPWTGIGLSDVRPLFRYCPGDAADTDGGLNRACSTIKMSYELAVAAYTMEPECWAQAGWQDFSMLVNRSLMTGAMLNGAASPINGLTRATLQKIARMKMSGLNPIGQYLGLHQPGDETASLKAIVMLKPQDGLMTVGIGFMGTGKQLGDWMPNLRMAPADSMHAGFVQLAEEFEGFLDQIVFPCTAGILDRPALTLHDIIDDLKRPGSAFRLWICGHSQGGAVMQAFIDRLLQGGVRREYICGYGFASPSVAHPDKPLPAEGYPIMHIFNADDIVPHMGAWRHLGECLLFMPGEADRKQMYGPAAEDPCTRSAMRLLQETRTAPDALMHGMAILRVLRRQSEGTLRGVFGEVENPVTELLSAGEGSILRLLDSLSDQLGRGYLAISGEPFISQVELVTLSQRWEALLRQYGVAVWVRAVMNAGMLPHRFYRNVPGGTAAYLYIVREGLPRLRRASAFIPRLNPLGIRASSLHAARPVYPGLSGGRVYRCTKPRIPDSPISEKTMPDAPEKEPASAPQTGPKRLKKPHRAAGYAAALRLLSASKVRRRGK